MKITFLSLFFCFSLFSCIQPFESNFVLDQKVLIVEGNLTTFGGNQFVRIREAIPNSPTSSFFRAVQGAKVSILVNEDTEIAYQESEPGYFLPPSNFAGEDNKQYRLKVNLATGEVLMSNPQTLRPVPPISKVYQRTNLRGKVGGNQSVPVTEIYLDTKDPPGIGDNYLWTWKNYEKQPICVSCVGGRWFQNPSPVGRCVAEPALQEAGTIYDYACNSDCWEIISSQEILAQSDFLSDGLTITGKKIAEIPFYNSLGGLLVVEQQLVSEEAYNYLKLLINQGQNTGGLADTPPAALVGNVRNINNPEVPIGGFFLVANTSTFRYWIDRSDLIQLNLSPYGLLKGRFINTEPSVDLRPPTAPCIVSSTRTDIKPFGF